jgi:hypothetical protein
MKKIRLGKSLVLAPILLMTTAITAANAAPSLRAVLRQQAPAQAAADDTEDRLLALLTERRDLLRRLADAAERRYRAGAVGAEAWHRAEIAVLKAELDLRADPVERIPLREEILQRASAIERMRREEYEQGLIRREAMTEATLGRVEAQVALGREKAAARAKSE